jgi:hypothetical protein
VRGNDVDVHTARRPCGVRRWGACNLARRRTAEPETPSAAAHALAGLREAAGQEQDDDYAPRGHSFGESNLCSESADSGFCIMPPRSKSRVLPPCTRLTKKSFAVEGLALICAERTRETRRFQSSSAPRVLYGTEREQQELKPRCRVARNCAERLRAGSSPTLVS